MNAFDRFVDALEAHDCRPRGAHGKREARCPAHDDRTASMSVKQVDDRVLVKCHAGCEVADIVAAVGLELKDLFDESRNGSSSIAATYDYVDEGGELLYQAVRLFPKEFRQRRPDGAGGWAWKLDGVRRVPYRLPQVLEAIAQGEDIMVVEGEKDVHALEKIGVVATCNPMGAGKWRAEYNQHFAGAKVTIVADRDEPGYEHAWQVSTALKPVAATVDVVEPSRGKDVAELLGSGGTLADLVEVAENDPSFRSTKGKRNEASSGEPSRSPLRVLDTRRFTETLPPPIDWTAEGVWARGKLTMFGGREKRGKSLIQMALGVTAASGGGVVAGITVKPGKVLLIDGENGGEEIHRRVRALGLRPEHAHNFIIAEARGFELREHLGEVRALIGEHKPDIVLLDSFRTLWRGKEDNDDVPPALDPLRQMAHDTGVAVSLVHHAQKGGDEYRGATAIGACVDWGILLEQIKDDDDPGRRRLTTPLPRFAPAREPRWLRILAQGDDGPIALAVAEPYAGEPGALAGVKKLMAQVGADGAFHSRHEIETQVERREVCASSTFGDLFPDLERSGFIETELRGREKRWKIKS